MRSRSLVAATILLLGSVFVAAASHYLAERRRSDAAWLLTRASAQASAYVESFDGRHVDAQLVTLSERRDRIGAALRYDLLRTLAAAGFGAALLWMYGLFLLSRLVPIEPATTESERTQRSSPLAGAPLAASR